MGGFPAFRYVGSARMFKPNVTETTAVTTRGRGAIAARCSRLGLRGRPDVDPGPAQRETPNPARPGREQRSGDPRVCRRTAGVHVGPALPILNVLPRPCTQMAPPDL